jgi:metal-responsive CopG/Arc/MetJ family transcriptional regulator
MKDVSVTITLPTAMLEEFDRLLVTEGETRSSVVTRLIHEALRDQDEQKDVRRYIAGYLEEPQTAEEFGWTAQVAVEALRQAEWDEGKPGE